MKSVLIAICTFTSISLSSVAVAIDADAGYELIFSLPNEGNSLTLASHTNAQGSDGVSVTFTRRQNKLHAVLATNEERVDLSEQLGTISATGTIRLLVDVHSHGDLLIDLPNGDLVGEEFRHRPTGRFWGVRSEGAVLTRAQAGQARHPH